MSFHCWGVDSAHVAPALELMREVPCAEEMCRDKVTDTSGGSGSSLDTAGHGRCGRSSIYVFELPKRSCRNSPGVGTLVK